MKKFLIFLCFGIIVLGGMPIFPEQVATDLDDLIQIALEQNPKVKAAENLWLAAIEVVPQAKAMPDPMLIYGHFFQSIETRLGPQRNKLSLSQKFPFFGKLSLKGKIAAEQAAVLEEQYNLVRHDVVVSVKEAFYALSWFEEAIEISQSEQEILKRLARVARKKYETGTASQQDALKAQLEISKISDRVLALEQGRRSASIKLATLINQPSDYEFGEMAFPMPAPLHFDLATLFAWAELERPELKKANQQIEKNELQLELTKKNYWPDFNIMVDYIDIGGGTTTMPEDGRNAWMAAVGINIPLWRGKLNASKAQATIRLDASRDIIQDIQNDTQARISELFHEIKMYEEQSSLYQLSLIPQAEQAFKAAEIGYMAGKADFLNILDAERMLLQLKTAYVKLQSDRSKSLARLERVVGRQLSSTNLQQGTLGGFNE